MMKEEQKCISECFTILFSKDSKVTSGLFVLTRLVLIIYSSCRVFSVYENGQRIKWEMKSP
jgi:hypothetical protein